jgi:hypothetical protein
MYSVKGAIAQTCYTIMNMATNFAAFENVLVNPLGVSEVLITLKLESLVQKLSISSGDVLRKRCPPCTTPTNLGLSSWISHVQSPYSRTKGGGGTKTRVANLAKIVASFSQSKRSSSKSRIREGWKGSDPCGWLSIRDLNSLFIDRCQSELSNLRHF